MFLSLAVLHLSTMVCQEVEELPPGSSGDLHETQCTVLLCLYGAHELLCRHP